MMLRGKPGQPETSESGRETGPEPQRPSVAELVYRYRVEESDPAREVDAARESDASREDDAPQEADAPTKGDAPGGSGAWSFVTAVERWMASARDTARPDGGPPPLHAEVTVALYQPVIGSETTEWELRIGFSSFAMLGRFLDEGQAELAELYDLGVEGVSALDVANPVLRRVGVRPSATTTTPTSSGSTG